MKSKIPSFVALASVMGIAAHTHLVTDAMENQARRDRELAYLAEATGREADDILSDFYVFPSTWEQFVFQLLNPKSDTAIGEEA